MKDDFKYKCDICGQVYNIEKNLMLCPKCREDNIEGKPLKGILKVQLPARLKNSLTDKEKINIFDFLPVEEKYFPSISVGNTPLIEAKNIQNEYRIDNIYLKFDGTNPTGSFKDRASYLVSAFAKKNNVNEIVVASTGNAASSMAGIAAAAEQKAFIFMPESAPKAKLVQCLQYGAELIPIKGDYDKAFDLSLKFSQRTGFLNRNTAYNPLTIEGKKTVSFELNEQMHGNEIDYIFLPVGDGVVLSGVIKGFNDLKYLGIINKIPKIFGVQAENSSFIYDAFYNNVFDFNYKASTIADSISVNVARNGYTAVNDLKTIEGEMVLVSDEEIMFAQHRLSKMSGVFCEPSSAASFAGFLKLRENISKNKSVVLLLTGHGLKDIDTALKSIKFPKSFEADIDYIIDNLKF
ncbi:MAG: threonine synthase [Bacteroidetes bacterium]|nr:threonine synthase [Bacteroidota bacterium]